MLDAEMANKETENKEDTELAVTSIRAARDALIRAAILADSQLRRELPPHLRERK